MAGTFEVSFNAGLTDLHVELASALELQIDSNDALQTLTLLLGNDSLTRVRVRKNGLLTRVSDGNFDLRTSATWTSRTTRSSPR